MLHKNKTPYVRDIYLAYLIKNANRTKTDEYPIIEKWMVATELPKEIIQWDRRKDTKDFSTTAISFYCNDVGFVPILGNPEAYIDKLSKYQLVIGLDASPYDNMPIVVQKSQIFLNLAITYYFGMNGIKIIPNVRIGDNRTLSSLEAYPHNTLISIGTNGFTKTNENRLVFIEQMKTIIEKLEPSGIIVYGKVIGEVFKYANDRNIPIYQYDSYTMKENNKSKNNFLSENKKNEG